MKKLTLTTAAAAAILCLNSLTAFAADTTKHGYGQGTAVDNLNRPTGAIEFNSQYSGIDAYALSEAENRIILTFDQGYENGYTDDILDVLKEKNVTAIFFLTGDYARKEKDLVNRMIAEGHVLGNHGMKHASLPTLTEVEAEEEIMSLHQFVLDKYNYEMQYFRCPCGEYSEESLEHLQKLGYKTLFWSYAYVDWKTDSQPSAGEGFEKLTESAHGGEILLLHSVSQTNAQILGDVIDNFRQQGFVV